MGHELGVPVSTTIWTTGVVRWRNMRWAGHGGGLREAAYTPCNCSLHDELHDQEPQ
jgi:hypothetical protein